MELLLRSHPTPRAPNPVPTPSKTRPTKSRSSPRHSSSNQQVAHTIPGLDRQIKNQPAQQIAEDKGEAENPELTAARGTRSRNGWVREG